MTRASRFRQRDIRAAIRGATGAGVAVEKVKISNEGEISVELKLTPTAPPTAGELEREIQEWNDLVKKDDGTTRHGKTGAARRG